MSASTITVTPLAGVNPDDTQSLVTVYGTLAWSASPDTYTTGGNTMNIGAAFPGVNGIQNAPIRVVVWSAATSGPTNLYVYNYSPGTTSANGKLQIFTGAAAQTALTELTSNASIPSGVSGDTIRFMAVFQRL